MKKRFILWVIICVSALGCDPWPPAPCERQNKEQFIRGDSVVNITGTSDTLFVGDTLRIEIFSQVWDYVETTGKVIVEFGEPNCGDFLRENNVTVSSGEFLGNSLIMHYDSTLNLFVFSGMVVLERTGPHHILGSWRSPFVYGSDCAGRSLVIHLAPSVLDWNSGKAAIEFYVKP